MDIDDLTIRQLKEIQSMGASSSGETALEIGKSYLVRGVTTYMLGKLVRITPCELVLDQASWVADTGRLGDAISKGTLGEAEFVGDGVIVFRGAGADALPWRHGLPTESK